MNTIKEFTLYRAALLAMTEMLCIYIVWYSKPLATYGHCALEMCMVKLRNWTEFLYKILTNLHLSSH